MADSDHLERLARGARAWNLWRRSHPSEQPRLNGASLDYARLGGFDLHHAVLNSASLKGADLGGAVLRGASLNGCDLSGARLAGADMSEARLDRALLRACDMSDVDLAGAHLSGADCSDARLERASLVGARAPGICLERAVLSGADLSGADLRSGVLAGAVVASAILRETVLANTDLSGARGLDAVRHLGPSTFDHRSFLRSGGLPAEFVRACGVPPEVVAGMQRALSSGTLYLSVFVSHAKADQAFVDKLFRDLREHGVNCWYAPEHLQAGERIRTRVHEEIERHDKLLVVVSKVSVASDWVAHEVEAALERERRERRDVLVPVQIDDCTHAAFDWFADVRRTRQIADFRRWQAPDAYADALLKLRRALRACEPDFGG